MRYFGPFRPSQQVAVCTTQAGRQTDPFEPIQWRCDTPFNDDLLYPSERAFLKDIELQLDTEPSTSDCVLEIRLDVCNLGDRVLENALVRLVVQDGSGTILTAGPARLTERLDALQPNHTQALRLSWRNRGSLLGDSEHAKAYRLLLTLEDGHGNILDAVAGEAMIRHLE